MATRAAQCLSFEANFANEFHRPVFGSVKSINLWLSLRCFSETTARKSKSRESHEHMAERFGFLSQSLSQAELALGLSQLEAVFADGSHLCCWVRCCSLVRWVGNEGMHLEIPFKETIGDSL